MRLAPQPSSASRPICLTTSAATIGTSTHRGALLLTCRSINLPSSDCPEGGQKHCREGVNSGVALHCSRGVRGKAPGASAENYLRALPRSCTDQVCCSRGYA